MQIIHPLFPIKLLGALLLSSLPAMLFANEQSTKLNTSDTSEQLVEKPIFSSRYDEAVFFLTPVFPVVDCEGAGEIEDSGVDEHFNTLFYYNDRDQSKYIVESEFVMGRNKASADKSRFVFNMMDSDQNGKVTSLEYRRYISQTIELADLDKNGELQDFELDLNKKTVRPLLTKNRDKKLLSLVKPSDTNHDPAHTNHKGHSHEQ
jgi:Ca2+-binding EF-hand superfamily protein